MGAVVRQEAKRGCGYRQEGGIYLVGGQLNAPCGKLPLELSICPTCKHGIKQARGWTTINPSELFEQGPCSTDNSIDNWCNFCPAGNLPEKAGLIWIGGKFYSTQSFIEEAQKLGISRRIKTIPKDLVVGETKVFLAHKDCIEATCNDCSGKGYTVPSDDISPVQCEECDGGGLVFKPGVFTIFTPTAIEVIVTHDTPQEKIEAYEKRGLQPVIVEPIKEQEDLPGTEPAATIH